MRRRWPFALACVGALALVGLAYSNHFGNGFHFDDRHVIVDNLAIRSLHDWGRFFTDATTFTARPENASYRPLLTLSHALDYRLGGGLVPQAFHRTQFLLLLLLGTGLVVFYERLAQQGRPSSRNRWLALFAATLFCVHTANTETINYLSSRSSLVATLGVVAAFLIWLLWPRGRITGIYLLPVLLGGLAKPLTVMFAPLLTVWVLFFDEDASITESLSPSGWRRGLRAVWRTLPAWLVCGGLFVAVRAMEPDTLNYANVERWRYAVTQPFVWLHYVRLFLWPTHLTADTDWRFLETWWDWRLGVGLLFLALLAVAIVMLSRPRRLRPAAFGLVWFSLSLLPSSSVFPLSEVYNEHRIFFPYVGLAFATVWCAWAGVRGLVEAERSSSRAVTVALAVLAATVLVAHASGTYRRNRVWTDDLTLWSDVAHKSPRNGRGLMNYGLALMSRGRLEEALEQFERGERHAPHYPILEVNLAIVKSALGRDDEAEAHYARAFQLDPSYGQAHYYYAKWLLKQERGPEAISQLETAIHLTPWSIAPRRTLLRLYAATARERELRKLAAETLRLNPTEETALALSAGRSPIRVDDPTVDGYVRAGRTRVDGKLWIDAAVLNRFALRMDPEHATGWNNLGWALGNLGFWDDSVRCFRRAGELDPEMEVARNNLHWAETGAAAARGD